MELTEGEVWHIGGLMNPSPWHGRCRADYSNTCGPPLPQKRAPLQKRICKLSTILVCSINYEFKIIKKALECDHFSFVKYKNHYSYMNEVVKFIFMHQMWLQHLRY